MDEVRADHRAMPARSVAGMGDRPTAMALYGAIVTALYRREKTGLGGEVRASLMGSGLWANAYLIQARLCGTEFPPRPPREESVTALGNIYRTSDERWFMLALASDRQWPALARAVGMPGLAVDPRFSGPEERRVNAVVLMGILDDVFVQRPLAEWRTVLDAAGLTFGVVGTVAEIVTDPQALANGMLRPLGDTGMLTVDSPFSVSGAEKVPVVLAPGFGEHGEEILRDAGYDEGEIEEFRAAGVIGG
jgi:formyl-CoA transferase